MGLCASGRYRLSYFTLFYAESRIRPSQYAARNWDNSAKPLRFIIKILSYTGIPSWSAAVRTRRLSNVVYHNKWLNINVSYSYLYYKNPIDYYYQYEQPYIAYSPINDNWADVHSVHYDLRLSHSKRLAGIEIRRRIQLYKSRFESIGRVTHFQAPMYYELTFNYKNFSAYYQGAIPCKGLSIPMIYDSELSSAIGVRYKYKDWAFQLSCDNFLTNPESHYHSIENSIVRTQGTSYVKNAWNRVMLKINFRFGKGKQYQEPVRKTVEEGL